MAKFDYNQAKQDVTEIIAIVETCPEPLREKCFELLFGAVFKSQLLPVALHEPPAAEQANQGRQKADQAVEQSSNRQERKLPANVLAFARRHAVTQEDLEKLFILDHEPLLPIYKIPTGKTAQAQLFKVMMVLLENGLLNNQLSAPYPELRETVKEDGLYDGNFNGMLKRNHALFRGAITKDSIIESEAVELTGAGLQRLAEIIKELGQA
ncbi:MAG: hypothetical protein WCF20_14630 [Methylovirgula sp.]